MPLLQPPDPDLRPSDYSYTHAYNSIVSRVRRGAGSGSGGVVIFSGVDIDGLLAARILASLFKQDDVSYKLVPVGSYSELQIKRDEALASEEIHTLILLSLGSLLPLAEYFKLPRGCHLHIIDSHRPWNLANLFGLELDIDTEEDDGDDADEEKAPGGRLWVWGDGHEQELGEVKKTWEALEYEPSDSEGDSDSDDDSEDDEDSEVSEGEESDHDDENDSQSGSGGSDADASPGPSRKRPQNKKRRSRSPSGSPSRAKRKRTAMSPLANGRPKRLTRNARDAHYDRIDRYYASGTSWGMSVAQSVYLLATVLERADNDLLWFAILGATSQYLGGKVGRERYEAYHELFADEVVRLNIAPADSNSNGRDGAIGIGGKTPNPDDRSIARTDELRFMLFRHWTLYDAMLHSGYVAGRLGIWKEKGRKRLQGLLAKMGYSLSQCTQSYAHMSPTLKRSLPSKLDSIAPEYGLVELTYPSFARSFGFQLSSLSAADAVEGLNALLEVASGQRMEVEREGGRGGGEWFGGTRTWGVGDTLTRGQSLGASGARAGAGGAGSTGAGDGVVSGQEGWAGRNFWIAYDACEDVTLLRSSLLLAKSLHTSIIRQGSSLLDKQSIRSLRSFRFCAIKEGPDVRLFTHPATLSRLAMWLMDATRDKWAAKAEKQKLKSLPFVVACRDEGAAYAAGNGADAASAQGGGAHGNGTQTQGVGEGGKGWIVVGITGGMEDGDVRKNKFGLAFQAAAEESGAAAKHDMFDTSIVEIGKDDLNAFIEALQIKAY